MYKLNLPAYYLHSIYEDFNDDLSYNSGDNEIRGFNNSPKRLPKNKRKIVEDNYAETNNIDC